MPTTDPGRAEPRADVDNEESVLRRFTASTPRGAGQNDVAALLRHVADRLAAEGTIDVADITFHVDSTDDGPWPSMTVYYEVVDRTEPFTLEDPGSTNGNGSGNGSGASPNAHLDTRTGFYRELARRAPLEPEAAPEPEPELEPAPEPVHIDDVLPLGPAAATPSPATSPTAPLPHRTRITNAVDPSTFARLKRLLRSSPRRTNGLR